jgi:hypothetical protein
MQLPRDSIAIQFTDPKKNNNKLLGTIQVIVVLEGVKHGLGKSKDLLTYTQGLRATKVRITMSKVRLSPHYREPLWLTSQ